MRDGTAIKRNGASREAEQPEQPEHHLRLLQRDNSRADDVVVGDQTLHRLSDLHNLASPK